jgi:hypothetical protein
LFLCNYLLEQVSVPPLARVNFFSARLLFLPSVAPLQISVRLVDKRSQVNRPPKAVHTFSFITLSVIIIENFFIFLDNFIEILLHGKFLRIPMDYLV